MFLAGVLCWLVGVFSSLPLRLVGFFLLLCCFSVWVLVVVVFFVGFSLAVALFSGLALLFGASVWGRHVVLPFSFPCFGLPGQVVALPIIKSCSSKKRIYDSGSFWVEEDRSADVYKVVDIPE